MKGGAGNETRTRDIHVGNVVLYQLSYSRRGGGSMKDKPTKITTNVHRELQQPIPAPRHSIPCGSNLARAPSSTPATYYISLRYVIIVNKKRMFNAKDLFYRPNRDKSQFYQISSCLLAKVLRRRSTSSGFLVGDFLGYISKP